MPDLCGRRLPVVDLVARRDTSADEQLPLLVAHDGPEYAELSSLVRLLDVIRSDGPLPPMRAALVPPRDRERDLLGFGRLLPLVRARDRAALGRLAPTPHGRRMRSGMGASLGALAMLHVHRTSPATFGALYLQSGKLLPPALRQTGIGLLRFRRISRFMGEVLTAEEWAHPIRVTMTCGTVEENLANNEATATRLLNVQGYDVQTHREPGRAQLGRMARHVRPHLDRSS